MKRWVAVSIFLLLLLAGLGIRPAAAQEQPIRVLSEPFENNFPVELFFKIEVESTAADISRIKLYYHLRGSTSQTQVPLEFTPARRVPASYRWHTEFQTVPPGAPILYHWEIKDKAGNTLTTEEKTYYYDDVRFDWKTLADEELVVFWYEGGDEFGQEVYDMASLSLRQLEERLGVQLDFSIRIVAYGSQEDFVSAFPRMNDWVGGRAFTAMGLTVQTMPPWDHEWVADVIPHEISHLLFYQVTDNPYVAPPAWLNEGLASYNELKENSYYDELVAQAAADGTLLPMAFIVGGFPADHERAILAYAQSYSLVKTLIDGYGWEKMGAYLHAFKTAKLSFDEAAAFQGIYGLSFEEFLAQWRISVGAAAGPTQIPSAVPTRTPQGTSQPGPTPTPPPGRATWPCASAALFLPPVVILWRRRRVGD